jgi:hypothetical protein
MERRGSAKEERGEDLLTVPKIGRMNLTEMNLQYSPWDASSGQNPESPHRGKVPSDKLATETPGQELGTEWLYRGCSGQQSDHYD